MLRRDQFGSDSQWKMTIQFQSPRANAVMILSYVFISRRVDGERTAAPAVEDRAALD